MFAYGETEVVCYWEKHPEAAPSPWCILLGHVVSMCHPCDVALDLSLTPLSQVLPENPLLFLLIEYLGGWLAMHISCFCLDFE